MNTEKYETILMMARDEGQRLSPILPDQSITCQASAKTDLAIAKAIEVKEKPPVVLLTR